MTHRPRRARLRLATSSWQPGCPDTSTVGSTSPSSRPIGRYALAFRVPARRPRRECSLRRDPHPQHPLASGPRSTGRRLLITAATVTASVARHRNAPQWTDSMSWSSGRPNFRRWPRAPTPGPRRTTYLSSRMPFVGATSLEAVADVLARDGIRQVGYGQRGRRAHSGSHRRCSAITSRGQRRLLRHRVSLPARSDRAWVPESAVGMHGSPRATRQRMVPAACRRSDRPKARARSAGRRRHWRRGGVHGTPKLTQACRRPGAAAHRSPHPELE